MTYSTMLFSCWVDFAFTSSGSVHHPIFDYRWPGSGTTYPVMCLDLTRGTSSAGCTIYAFVGDNSGNGLSITTIGSTGYTPLAAGWHHVMLSYNSALSGNNRLQLAIDGVNITGSVASFANVGTGIPSAVDLSLGAFAIGTNAATNNHVVAAGSLTELNACLSELWFTAGQSLDLSVATNVQLFRTTAGHPVDLLTNGSGPTGTAPLLYPDNTTYTTNRGTGLVSTLTEIGTLSQCGSYP